METPARAISLPVRPKRLKMPTRPNPAGKAACDSEHTQEQSAPATHLRKSKKDRLHKAQSAATALGMSAPFWNMANATADERVAHALNELKAIYTEYGTSDNERTDVLAAFVFGASTKDLTPRNLYPQIFEAIAKAHQQAASKKEEPYRVPQMFLCSHPAYSVLYIATLILGTGQAGHTGFRFPQEEVARAYNLFFTPAIDSKTICRFLYEVVENTESKETPRKRIILPKYLTLEERGKPGIGGNGKPSTYRLKEGYSIKGAALSPNLLSIRAMWDWAQYEFLSALNNGAFAAPL